MKDSIHPEYKEISVSCSCGNVFKDRRHWVTICKLDVCSSCHPFYTGKQKMLRHRGSRRHSFRKKYAGIGTAR